MALKLSILLVFLFLSACAQDPMAATQPGNAANSAVSEYSININTATLEELQRIPHIGEKLAERIIEYRKVNGPFRRVEYLMLIDGISDKRFRKIRPMVRVE